MPPDRGRKRHGGRDRVPRPGEIYFEFQRVGNAVKVTAVDAATGVEVIVMGPLAATQGDLERVAMAKLKWRLEQADRE